MIGNLQVLRAFAAIAIVLYHTNCPLINGLPRDFQAVSVFFVISGFIMTYIILKDDRQQAPAVFLSHRIIRIVPMYWLAVFVLVVFSNLGLLNLAVTLPALLKMAQEGPLRIVRWLLTGLNLFSFYRPADLLQTFLFIPYKDVNGDLHPVLGVGWTLNLEMFFYVVYALSLFARKLFAPVIAAVSVASIWGVGQLTNGYADSWFGLYASAYVPYFVVGILTYYAWRMMEQRLPRQSLAWIAFALLALYVSAQFAIGLLPKLAPVALVLAALLAHSAGKRIVHPSCFCWVRRLTPYTSFIPLSWKCSQPCGFTLPCLTLVLPFWRPLLCCWSPYWLPFFCISG